jgi:hypothetical protein
VFNAWFIAWILIIVGYGICHLAASINRTFGASIESRNRFYFQSALWMSLRSINMVSFVEFVITWHAYMKQDFRHSIPMIQEANIDRFPIEISIGCMIYMFVQLFVNLWAVYRPGYCPSFYSRDDRWIHLFLDCHHSLRTTNSNKTLPMNFVQTYCSKLYVYWQSSLA